MNKTRRAQLTALAQTLAATPEVTLINNAPLSRYAWVGIGGPADMLVIAHSRAALLTAMQGAQAAELPWRVFGSLSNVLLPDAGLRGVTILNHARAATFTDTQQLHAESGAIVVKVAHEAVRRGLGGLTWAVGLPGTVGGAVINNAGAFGGEIAGILTSAEVVGPDGAAQEVGPDWFAFRYRASRLKEAGAGWLVLAATLQLTPRDPAGLAEKAADYTARRQRTQPPGKTLGSTFKNPPGDYAGRLIEAAGLKGARQGGCCISTQHANFLINEGSGTAADFLALVGLAQTEVQARFGVMLEPEIEILDFGSADQRISGSGNS
ncbi:MAG TPA: UDP-N-acetylmuramate dehydrogenase [Anaerolineae bacterium]|nr:UDP-N-acetylmuramate dehydrogenase [Anaerolineae bacterium]